MAGLLRLGKKQASQTVEGGLRGIRIGFGALSEEGGTSVPLIYGPS